MKIVMGRRKKREKSTNLFVIISVIAKMYFSEYLPRLNSISVALDVQSGFNIDEINRISIAGELLSIELKTTHLLTFIYHVKLHKQA